MKLPVSILVWLAANAMAPAAEPSLPAAAFPSLPPKSPEEAVATFDLDPALRIELVAAEPLIADPVAISFDENGVLYVCEMRDYSERRDEKLGRISRLKDRDADGRMDHATVFAEGLPWPTGVLCYDGGVFVMAAPDLWFFKDTNGDGVADVRRVVLTGFSELASRLNVQQLPNSLRWGPDQRVHLAEGGNGSRVRRPEQKADEGLVLRGRDLSFNPRTLELRAESGGGQYGMAFDDVGRKFVSSNSRHLMQIAYDVNLPGDSPIALPAPAMDIAVDGPAAPVFRRSPDEAWRVIRTRWRVSGISPGLIEGGGVPSGYFTGATGVQIYRGDALPDDYFGNAFVADCGSNLVHRKRLVPAGVVRRGERPALDEHREFLASTDNWFRPVQLENGPSGGLYIVDLYREIIEHPWSLPPGIKEHLDLNRGNDRGRIWRIVSKTATPHRTVRLGEMGIDELVASLAHRNGWHRETAARLLSQRDDPAVGELLRRTVADPSANARLGALELLAARRELDAPRMEAGLRDIAPEVRMITLRLTAGLATPLDWNLSPWREHAIRLAADDDPEVQFTLALALGRAPLKEDLALALWRRLAPSAGRELLLQQTAVRLIAPSAPRVWYELRESPKYFVADELAVKIAELAARSSTAETIAQWLVEAAAQSASGGEYASRRLLLLAAGVARDRDLLRKLKLPDSFEPQLAEAALRSLTGAGGSSAAPPAAWWVDALTMMTGEQGWARLRPLLKSLPPGVARELVAGALVKRNDLAATTALLDSWNSLSPSIRSATLDSILKNAAGLELVLGRAGDDAVFRAQLGPTFRQAAREHANEAVRARAVAIFGESSSATTSEGAKRYASSLALPGDAAQGRAIYQLRCASCHRAAGEGFDLGPDLLTVAAAGRESLLANILEPNREVAPRFEAWTAKLKDGEEATGILSAERPEEVAIRAAGGIEQVVARSNLTALASTGKSLMPEGLDEGMSAEAMADLLRFIESLAEPPAGK